MGLCTKPVSRILFIVVICLQELIVNVASCPTSPSRCMCSLVRGGSKPERTPRGRRLQCANRGFTSPVDFEPLPADTVQLDLSDNQITELQQDAFANVTSLERLDLSNNRISIIQPGAFNGLTSLKRLDLSQNKIGNLNNSMFVGLNNLERLNLSNNRIASISAGTFNGLENLQLDLHSDFLMCDCLLKWIIKWSKNNDIKISDSTLCEYPRALKGEKLKSLRGKDLHCDYPLELPIFDLTPSNNQVVFLGDSLPMSCITTYVGESTKMIWYKNRKEVDNQTAGLQLHTYRSHDGSTIIGKLTIQRLQLTDGGMWECQIMSSRGNESRSVSIVVLENTEEFCKSDGTTDTKGHIEWPMTVAGSKTYQRCPHGAGYGFTAPLDSSAKRYCRFGGIWDPPDTSTCQYDSTNTQWLQRLSLTTITNATNAMKKAQELEVQTSDARTYTDKMDAVFIAKTMEQFSKFTDPALGEAMINIASNVMDMPEDVLAAAQQEQKACSRIVTTLEKFAGDSISGRVQFRHIAPNIGLEAFHVGPNTFEGRWITCASLVRDGGPQSDYDDNHFKCSTANINATQLDQHEPVEASIELPRSLFAKLREKYSISTDRTYRLQVLFYKNGKLFPNTGNSTNYASNNGRKTVTTSVISSKFAGFSLENLTEPIILTFRPHQDGAEPVAAFWNFEAISGHGAWDSNGCKIVRRNENMTTVECSHLTNFAILKDLNTPDGHMEKMSGWNSGILQPIVYVGSGVCLIAIMTTVMTYIGFISQIRICRKSVHTLLNLCISLIMTVGTFAGGINRTEPEVVCYIIGIAIHYFTLCTLVWMAIAARNLNRRLCKKDKVLPPGEPPPPPRPMLRFYFLGWGLPSLVVGISAAADLEKYGGSDYCWLEIQSNIESSLQMLAFLAFVSLMFLINIVYFVSTSRKLQTMPRKYEVKQIEQNRENENQERDLPVTDLESLGTHTAATSVATSFLDAEHSFQSQLRSLVFMLFCFLAMWVCAAMSITQEDYLNVMFSYSYGIASAALGIFIFSYNCVMRNDVRLSWLRCCGCQRRTRYAFSVDSGSALQTNGQVYHHKQSASSIDSSFTNRSNTTNRSYHSNPVYKAIPSGRKTTNMYVDIPSHSAMYTDQSFSTIDSRTHPFPIQERPNGYPAYRFMHKNKNRPPNSKYGSRPHHESHSQKHVLHRDMVMNSLPRIDNRPQSRGSVADSHSSFPESYASTVRGGPSQYGTDAKTPSSINSFPERQKDRDKVRGGSSREDCSKSHGSLPRDLSKDSSLGREGRMTREHSSHSIKQRAATPQQSQASTPQSPTSTLPSPAAMPQSSTGTTTPDSPQETLELAPSCEEVPPLSNGDVNLDTEGEGQGQGQGQGVHSSRDDLSSGSDIETGTGSESSKSRKRKNSGTWKKETSV
ncbi:adhesion G protein-coupled receptor A3-like [Glandiceps talaboti]